VVDQRGIVTDWFPVITAALCKLSEEQSERIFSSAGARKPDELSLAVFCGFAWHVA